MLNFDKNILKIIFGISLIVFFLQNISALSFGISPEKIEISGKINEEICGNFSLIGDENLIFVGEVKWAEENIKNILNYNISSQDIGITASYPQQTKQGKYTLCIKGNKEGEYYGALFYKIEGTSYGVGTWINVYLEREEPKLEKEVKRVISLTGKVIGEKIGNSKEKIYLFQIIFLIFLLIVLFILSKKTKRRNKTKKSIG